MTFRATGLTVALLLATAPLAAAQTLPRPDMRAPATMAQRIRAGIQQGQLTRREVGRLRAVIAAHRARAAAMRGTGQPLSQAQRLELRRGLRTLNRQIFQLRHNRAHRGR